MTLLTAVKLAIHALNQQQKNLHYDANMFERCGYDYPQAVSASKERQRMRLAVSLLQELLSKLPQEGPNEPTINRGGVNDRCRRESF